MKFLWSVRRPTSVRVPLLLCDFVCLTFTCGGGDQETVKKEMKTAAVRGSQ